MNSETPPWGAPLEKRPGDAVQVGSSSPRVGSNAPPPPKPQVPDHELIRCIGRGGYGEVWLARNIMGTFRAVKVVHRSSFDHDRPFEREFDGIRRFEPISRTHESQLNVLHVGRGEGYFYYVMELADDQGHGQEIDPGSYAPRTLRSELHHHGRLPFEQCLRIALALTTALDHLHQHGLVHRDIKPSNIIFVNGIPKLADIGLVAQADATLSFVGTEGYVPPEGPGSPQADIYSLGKLLYEISTGRDRQDYPELPTNLRELPDREGVVELNEVIIKACQAEPSRRYVTAREMHGELVLLQSGKSLARLRTVERTLAKLKRFSVVGLGVTTAIAAGFFWQSNQARRMKALATAARENLYAADINGAQRALEADNLRQAVDLLHKQIPKPNETDLRGFEWRYLWRQCQSEELFTLQSHDVAGLVAFSPDGRSLATGNPANRIELWDFQTRKIRASLVADSNRVESLCFSPDGHFLATASSSAVCVWDAKNLQQLRFLPGAAEAVRFSPVGNFLLTWSTNGLILWDARNWNIVNTLSQSGSSHEIWYGRNKFHMMRNEFRFDFSADESLIGLNSEDGVKLYTVPDLKEVGFLADRAAGMRFVAFSPDGRTLAACTSRDRTVKLWDIERLKELRSLSGHSDFVHAIAFSPDGKTLATASADYTIKLWDMATGEVIRTFRGHSAGGISFSPDNKLLASVDGTIRVWDITNPAHAGELTEMRSLGYSSDGNLLTYSTKGTLTFLEPESLERVHSYCFTGRGENISVDWRRGNPLAYDGRTVAMRMAPASPERPWAGWMELWDLSRGQFLSRVDGVELEHIQFSSMGRFLGAFNSDEALSLWLWQMPHCTNKLVLTDTNGIMGWALSPDETTLATKSYGAWKAVDLLATNAVDLWDITGKAVRHISTLDSKGGWGGLAFSPDGRVLASPQNDGLIRLLDVSSGRTIMTLPGHNRGGIILSFTPDGRTLVSSGQDGTVRFWHVATGRELMKFQIPIGDLVRHELKLSPDGRSLVVNWMDVLGENSRVWFAPSLAEIAVAESTDYTSLAHDPATWLAVGKALEKRDRLDEVVEAFGNVIQSSANQPALEEVRKSALSRRAKLLVRLGRFAEAAADNIAALELPPRDARAPTQSIDLSPYYNGTLDWNSLYSEIPRQTFLGELPRGIQVLPGSRGVPFDVRGVLQVNNELDFPGIPHAMTNIAIRRKCRRLHFLHATHRWEAGSGTKVATYVFHFSDGRQEEFPILYGRDVHDWVPASNDPLDKQGGNMVWNDKKTGHRVYMSTWENPRPESEITTFDFTSTMTKCGPFLIAVSVD